MDRLKGAANAALKKTSAVKQADASGLAIVITRLNSSVLKLETRVGGVI